MNNALSELLALPEQEKQKIGVVHTPQEIDQQPATWRATLSRLSSIRIQICRILEGAGITQSSSERPHILLVGAGTSDYIGRAISRILHQEWRCDVTVVASTELLTNVNDFILPDRKYLLISFSRSGDSSEGIAVMELTIAQYPKQIRHLLVTCNASGAMAQFEGVESVVLDDVVNDRGLAMTSSFTNMVIAGQYLANVFTPQRYEHLVAEMINIGSRLIPKAADLSSKLAQMRFSRMCFLGGGSLQAVAEEASLKVLELNGGKIATLAQSPLGLRHGPLSFINNETLVVAHLSAAEERLCYELDLLEEVRQKELGAEIVIVSPRITRRMMDISNNLLSLDVGDSFPDAYRVPLDIIFGQLLGLFTCLANDGTPDTPSAGAINRVVSHVKIYPAVAKWTRQSLDDTRNENKLESRMV